MNIRERLLDCFYAVLGAVFVGIAFVVIHAIAFAEWLFTGRRPRI